jgi:hypothetical protein
MPPDEAKSFAAIGFLTVVEDPQHGYFGGYLVLSPRGRPLEFHCTTPVQPTPAQKILYGTTLRSYLLGELIGLTLIEKSKLPVLAILTDLPEMLTLADLRDEPLVLVGSDPPGEDSLDEAVPSFSLAQYRVRGTSTCTWRCEELAALLAPLAAQVDLLEPFERIREAIREAQRVAAPQLTSDDDSAAAA